MIVDHDSAVPVWRQVAAWLAGQIKTAGQRMPSESTIEQELGVSRGTVRHAYRHLADQGWVVIVSGKGAFAASPLPEGKPQV
jgi:DNA-binding GntR family transcriptional regulator